MSRAIFAAVLSVALASRASAQPIPQPPPAYAAASIGLDLVLEPLVSAAEGDLGRGELAMALARAQVVLAEAPASSAVHVRAEGLLLVARQRLGATPPGTVTTDDAYAPLVEAATADTGASRFDLARARLAWIDAHVPPGSALAIRSTAVRAALDARIASTPAPTAATVTPATSLPTGTWRPVTMPERPPVSTDPRRRTDTEIVDLYITGGLMGAYLGAWTAQSSGWLDGHAADDASRVTAIAMIAGAGVMTLGVFGLDQIDRGPRMGQPGTISQGIRFGFVLSGLSLGVLSADHSYRAGEMLDAMGIGVLGGAAIGTLFAYTLDPHPAQVQFTQTTGVWGALLGAEFAALVAPLAFPNFGSQQDRMRTGFGITLGGLSVGILAGLMLSATHENFSARRSWLTTLGLIAGSGAGALIWTLISLGARNFDLPTLGACGGVGGIGGLVLAALLTDGDHGPRSWDDTPDVRLSVAPTMGGATLGLDGTF